MEEGMGDTKGFGGARGLSKKGEGAHNMDSGSYAHDNIQKSYWK
jgi:hypothetical protein